MESGDEGVDIRQIFRTEQEPQFPSTKAVRPADQKQKTGLSKQQE